MTKKGGKRLDIQGLAYFLIEQGFNKNASDFYIFPTLEGKYEFTYRYHTQKITYFITSKSTGEKIILFFKYLAGMNVAEKRKVQAGSATVQLKNTDKRIRLSTMSDFQGRESLVIRFLYSFSNQEQGLTLLQGQWNRLKKSIATKGLYLFCGPTGSGKTTIMYQLAQMFKTKQVITIEDPVEIEEPTFLQLQVNEALGLTYEELIKACLRHRPDVLIVGEIRDAQTAKMVVRAALTGHLVFSTVHALNKASVWQRLAELGVNQEELAQSLRGIVYQELLPVKCLYCASTCTEHCSSYASNYGLLMDMSFIEGGRVKYETTDWQHALWKAWSYGFITEATVSTYSG